MTIGLLMVALLVALLVCYQQDFLSLTLAFIAGTLGLLSIHWLGIKRFPNLKNALALAHDQNENLQYSAQLLEATKEKEKELSGLAVLQREKAKDAFSSFSYKLPWDYNHIKKSIFLMAGLILGAWSMQSLYTQSSSTSDANEYVHQVLFADSAEEEQTNVDTAFIKSISISIAPPPVSYTHLTLPTICSV